MKILNFSLILLLVSLLSFSCEKSTVEETKKTYYQLEEEFNTEGAEEILLGFVSDQSLSISDPNLSIAIYGHDTRIMDAPATLITRQHFTLEEIPAVLIIKIPSNAASMVDPKIDEESIGYYFHLIWDSDNNLQFCEGDIVIDYDKKWPTFDVEETEIQTFFLRKLSPVYQCD